MTTWLIIAAIVLAEAAAVAYAAWVGEPSGLRRLIAINIIAVVCFAPLMGEIGPWRTNYGNIWYATAIGAQLVLLECFGRLAASDVIVRCYFAITTLLVITWPLSFAPLLPGNEILGGAVVALSERRTEVLIASYAAIGPTLAVVDIIHSKLRRWSMAGSVGIAAIAGQTIDSLIFFPLAFHGLGLDFVVDAIVAGLVLKIPVTIAIACVGIAVVVARRQTAAAV